MRILLLAQFYPPIVGGIERHVQSLGAALAARGHDLAVVTLQHGDLPAFELDGAVRVYRIRASMQRIDGLFTIDRQHAPPFPDPEAVAAIRQIITREKPDIVHAHNWLVHSFLPLKRWSGARLVVTLHDCELTCVQMRYMYRDADLCSGPAFGKCLGCAAHHYGLVKGAVTLLGNRVMSGVERSLVDMFLPVSRAVAQASQLTGSTPFEVVPNFIPDDVAEEAQTAGPLPPEIADGDIILQAGDLVRDKGIEVLLEAYGEFSAAPPLVLIGRRFDESPATFPPNVHVYDSMPHPMIMKAWQRSICGVVPSLWPDSCPTVTLEAMASGRAVIGSRIGGIIDQISDGETGLLVPPGDAAALRQAMQRLIDEPVLRARMGEAARERVRAFQASTVVTTIEGIFQSLLSPLL